MKPYQANLFNGIILVLMGLWGYFSSENPSMTAFIPVAFGTIFILATPPFKSGNKIVAHFIVVLTFLLFIMLIFKPFMSAWNKGNVGALIRIGVMIVSCLIALIVYVKNFIDVRKARPQQD